MKKATEKNRYSKLSGQYSFIARCCDCSPAYVKSIAAGRRVPKTGRAKKAEKVLAALDQLIEMTNN